MLSSVRGTSFVSYWQYVRYVIGSFLSIFSNCPWDFLTFM